MVALVAIDRVAPTGWFNGLDRGFVLSLDEWRGPKNKERYGLLKRITVD